MQLSFCLYTDKCQNSYRNSSVKSAVTSSEANYHFMHIIFYDNEMGYDNKSKGLILVPTLRGWV